MRRQVLTNTHSQHGSQLFRGDITAEDVFKHFDTNNDGAIDKAEFGNLLVDLFRDSTGYPHQVSSAKTHEMFEIFNTDLDKSYLSKKGIRSQEFQHAWSCWIKPILRPVSAIIIIDVQNDFITGSLAIKDFPAREDGYEVVPVVNKLLDDVPFDNIFYSQDWHPKEHISFFDNINLPGRELAPESPIQNIDDAKELSTVIFKGPPKINQTLWPRHCVQGSEGAELHKEMRIHPLSETIQKGTNPRIDSESAFFDNNKLSKTELDAKLKEKGVTDVYTCGICTDVCVSATSRDALDLGYRTILIEDSSRGVFPEGIKETKDTIRQRNGLVVNSGDVKDLVQGLNRPVELGYMKALQCKP